MMCWSICCLRRPFDVHLDFTKHWWKRGLTWTDLTSAFGKKLLSDHHGPACKRFRVLSQQLPKGNIKISLFLGMGKQLGIVLTSSASSHKFLTALMIPLSSEEIFSVENLTWSSTIKIKKDAIAGDWNLEKSTPNEIVWKCSWWILWHRLFFAIVFVNIHEEDWYRQKTHQINVICNGGEIHSFTKKLPSTYQLGKLALKYETLTSAAELPKFGRFKHQCRRYGLGWLMKILRS